MKNPAIRKDLELVSLCNRVGNITLAASWYTEQLAEWVQLQHPGVDFKDLTLGQILKADKEFSALNPDTFRQIKNQKVGLK